MMTYEIVWDGVPQKTDLHEVEWDIEMRGKVVEAALKIDIQFVGVGEHAGASFGAERVFAVTLDHLMKLANLLVDGHVARFAGYPDDFERAVVTQYQIFHRVDVLAQ